MFGLGTIINTACIIAGGLLGRIAGRLLTERFRKSLNTALAVSILAMSLAGIAAKMLVKTETGYDTTGSYLLIFALVLGAPVGEWIDLDRRMERFGEWLKKKTGNARDPVFVTGFVTASMTVSIGAMAVVGSLMDGMNGDFSILLTKGILDFIIILVMTASLGRGCVFSAIPVFFFQGSMTLLARLIAPVMTETAIADLSLVGSCLILCVGINLLFDGKFRIKVANLLPAVVFAVVWAFLPWA